MFRVILISLSLLLFATLSCCQESDTIVSDNSYKPELSGFISPIQVMPKYKHGSFEELKKQIQDQLIIPERDSLEGLTILSFKINTKGKVENPKILRSVSEKIDVQLLKLILNYDFVPGEYGGKACDVTYNLPFKFN